MTVLNLIRKGGLAQFATVTTATLATQETASAATVAQVATVAVANHSLTIMTEKEETAILTWLAYIGETNPAEIAEVMDQCNADEQARAYFLKRAEEVPSAYEHGQRATCGACNHFRRARHPNLGHCACGQPEAPAGLWDNDQRWCERFIPSHIYGVTQLE